MKTYKTKDEFKVGKYDISLIDSSFFELLPEKFGERKLGKFQKLTKSMSDSQIESELQVGLCELGDILAFLKNPLEECKDGYANLFYTRSCVVNVHWLSGGLGWRVSTWGRDGLGWLAGRRVFSPATDSKSLSSSPSDSLTLAPSLTLAIQVCKDAGYIIYKPI